MKKFIKDIPIITNGFAVGMLFFATPMKPLDILCFALAGITFFWYGYNQKTNK